MSKEITRRDFLKIAGAAGAAVGLAGGLGGLAAACGAEEATTTTASTAGPTTSATQGSTTSVSTGPETGREVKIGVVIPDTGGLSFFGLPDSWCMETAKRVIGSGRVLADGKMHPITFLRKDTQSDTMRASQVASDLINTDNIDLMTASGAPDTVNPAADQAENLGCPFICTNNLWTAFVQGRGATLDHEFQWTFGHLFGPEQEAKSGVNAYNQLETNKKVALLFPNSADSAAWLTEPYDVPTILTAAGYTYVFPAQYSPGTEDFSAQISQFKKEGCEIAYAQVPPADFSNFLKQSLQQSFHPRAISSSLAAGSAEAIQPLGALAAGITTGCDWTPDFPLNDSLTGKSGQELKVDYENETGRPWSGDIGMLAKYAWAIDVLERAANLDDKASIRDAIKATKLDTLTGTIDFTKPVGEGKHVTPNVNLVLYGFAQWRASTTTPGTFDIVVVATDDPSLKVKDSLQPMVYES